MKGTRMAVLAALSGLLIACSGKQEPVAGPLSAGPGEAMEIAVHNETTSSLRIYAEVGGDEMQLGRVDALGQRSLRIPYGAGGTVRLVARPAAGSMAAARHRSEPIQIIDGQRVEWHLRLSPGVSGVPRISTVRVFACSAARC
jgi:hypothetical protein